MILDELEKQEIDDRYDHLAPWHYVNMDQNTRYSEALNEVLLSTKMARSR